MMPLHPKGALVSNSEPVGAAGYRRLVVLSMRRFSPARERVEWIVRGDRIHRADLRL
jgi:hypothetical protein